MIYVSCSNPVGAGSTSVPPPYEPPLPYSLSLTQQSSLKICVRGFGGGSPERQIELRSQNESLELCCSSSADCKHTPKPQCVPSYRNLHVFLAHTCTFLHHTAVLGKRSLDLKHECDWKKDCESVEQYNTIQ